MSEQSAMPGESKSGSKTALVIVLGCLGALVILAAVAGVVVLVVVKYTGSVRGRAQEVRVSSQVKELELSCVNFRLDCGRYPWAKPGEVIATTTIDPQQVYAELKGRGKINSIQDYLGKMPERFLKDGRVVDLWGNPIQFRVNPDGLEPVVWSYGPDGKDNTNDGAAPNPRKQPKSYYWYGAGDTGDDITNL